MAAQSIQLPPLVQQIILDPRRLTTGAAAVTKASQAAAKGTDALNTSAFNTTQSLTSLGFRAQTVGRIFTKKFALPIVGAVGLGITSFARFEQQLAKIEGLVGISGGAIDQFSASIREISASTGRAPQELAEAMFFITSAGLRGAVAMDTLNAAAKGAAIGLGQAKVVADAATSAVNAYGAENLSAMEATDILTAAVREGKVEADRLAPAIGKAIPVASAMGIQFHEVAAAISAMTRTGTDARTAAIQLRQIMQSLLDPSRQTEKALLGMGIAQGELADQARERGLLSVLIRLRDLAEENEEAFADVFPNIRALAGALDITGANLEENTRIFEALANATGDTDVAFQKVEKTLAFRLSKATAEFKVALVELGQAFAPLVELATGLIGVFSDIVKFFANNDLGKTIVIITLATAGAALAFGKAAVAAGIYAASIEFLQGQHLKLNAAQVAAARSTKLFTAAMGSAVAFGVVAFSASLGLLLTKMGQTTNQSLNNAVRLQGVINDIKQVGEDSLRPMESYVNVLKDLKRAANISADPSVLAFMTAFGDIIQKTITDEGEDAGAQQLVQAITNTFAGLEPTQANQRDFEQAIFAALSQFNLSQSVLDEALEGVFDTTDLNAIFNKLTEDDTALTVTRAEFQASAQTFADQIVGDMDDLITTLTTQGFQFAQRTEELMEIVNGASEDFTLTPNSFLAKNIEEFELPEGEGAFIEMLEALRNDAVAVFGAEGQVANQDLIDQLILGVFGIGETGELGDLIVEAFTKDELGRIVDIQEAIQRNVVAGLGIDPQDPVAQEIGRAIDKLMTTALREADDFTDDRAGDSLAERLLGLDSFNADDISNTQFLETTELLAEKVKEVTDAFNDGNPDIDERIRLYREANPIATEQNAILATAVEILEELAEAEQEVTQEGRNFMTVAEVFSELETALGELDDKAETFEKRFKLLFGTLNDARGSTQSLREDFDNLADSLAGSKGDFSEFTREGRATRDEARDVFEGIGDELGARLRAGLVDEEEAADEFLQRLLDLEATLIANGVAAEEAARFISELTGGQDIRTSIALLAAPENQEITNAEFIEGFDRMKEDVFEILNVNDAKELGGNFSSGITSGMVEEIESEETARKILIMKNSLLGQLFSQFGIFSPSIVMAEEIGRPLTAGIAKGIMDERGKLQNPIMELVEDTIKVSTSKINTVANAVTAQLDLREAEFNRDVALRDFGSGGEITRREGLQRQQLERRIKQAQRAVRLGQGNQEDLELTLLDAQNALDDFDRNVTSEGPAARANIALMNAGSEAAIAFARMKMEGQEAIDLFKNLAGAVGLPTQQVEDMLDVAASNEDIFRRIFDDDTIHAIERAADGWMRIAEGSGKVRGLTIFGNNDTDAPDAPRELGERLLGFSSSGVYTGQEGGLGRLFRDRQRSLATSIGAGLGGSYLMDTGMVSISSEGIESISDAVRDGLSNVDVYVTLNETTPPKKWKQEATKTLGAGGSGYGIF